MSKSKTKWTLTDEAKKQIPAWNKRWADIIRRTTPMTAREKREVEESLREMYRLAGLDGASLRVVFVASPLMAAVVAGAAASWWHTCSSTAESPSLATSAVTDLATASATDLAAAGAIALATRAATAYATRTATDLATRALTDLETAGAIALATGEATDLATRAATASATVSAIDLATGEATDLATRAATASATILAIDLATDLATASATASATSAATNRAADLATDSDKLFCEMLQGALSVVGDSRLARMCIERSWSMRNGGNQWAPWCSYLSFVRDVVGWRSPLHAAYAHYERCAVMSGPRYMHPNFCIVSDFPTKLEGYIDHRGIIVAHNDRGPSHAWADGWSIWTVHGVRVDRQIVLSPETQTITQINSEASKEVRRVRIDRFGWEKYLIASRAAVIDRRINDRDSQTETLYRMQDGTQRFVCVDTSTGRRYALGVPRNVETCERAQNWMSHGLDSLAIHRS